MKLRNLFIGSVAGLALTGVASAGYVTIDLTSNNTLNDVIATGSFSVGGITGTVNSSGALNKGENFSSASFCSAYALECDKDGLGSGDDEFTAAATIGTGEYVEFGITAPTGSTVSLIEIYVLDMFTKNGVTNPSNAQRESVRLSVNGSFENEYFSSTQLSEGIGFAAFAANYAGVNSLRFDPGLGKDDGSADFALAGFKLEVTPVPIPAAAWLFASALGVFGYLGKRKENA